MAGLSNLSQTQAQVGAMFIVSGTVQATVSAAVLTKTTNLATGYRSQYLNQTSGNVVNDSVIVDPMWVQTDQNNVTTYYVSIRWKVYAVPV